MTVPDHARQRLESLGRGTPEWRSWLDLLGATLSAVNDPAWDGVEARLDGDRPPDAPVLAGAEIVLDGSLGRRWVRRLLTKAAEGGGSVESLGAAAPRLDSIGFLQAAVCQDTDAIARLAASGGADKRALLALVGLAAVPLLHACGRRLARRVPEAWSQGYCPVCGAWPTLGEVRGLEQSLRLRCARCGGDWRWERLCCPFCGELHHERLGALVSDAHRETQKVETCASCRGYLKTRTTLQPYPPEEIAVEDLGTVDLDMAALERGYSRPSLPGYRLGARLVEAPTRVRAARWRRVIGRRS